MKEFMERSQTKLHGKDNKVSLFLPYTLHCLPLPVEIVKKQKGLTQNVEKKNP